MTIKTGTIRTKTSALAVAGVATLFLAGCGGGDDSTDDAAAGSTTAPIEAPTEPATGDATLDAMVEESVDDNEPVGDEESTGAGAQLTTATLPDEWPADIPTPSDDIIVASWVVIGDSTAGSAIFHVADAAAQQAYLDKLSASGFTIEESTVQPDNGTMYTAKSEAWSINLVIGDTDGNPTVNLATITGRQ